MREFNALRSYPQPSARRVGSRTIHHRIIASYRGREFFDGERDYGYGGLKYDKRWQVVAEDLRNDYALVAGSRVLQFGCEKGFLLAELQKNGIEIVGVESSSYARHHALPEMKPHILPSLPLRHDKEYTLPFDLVIAIGTVYSLNLGDAMEMLRRIEAIGFNAFITLASYDTEEDLRLFKKWSLLGTTILRKDEWREVMNHAGYTGDYWFVSAETLKLRE